MNILVLHNNNVPFFLRIKGNFTYDNITIDALLLKYDSSIYDYDFDTYISKKLVSLKESVYDLIVLPYTFNKENYIEYTGLHVAAHIRLTPSWKKIATPILFIGPDSEDDIIKTSKLAGLLNSRHVFTAGANTKEGIVKAIRDVVSRDYIESDDSFIISDNYKNLINSLIIPAPSNYATHHSIANEWAVLRWSQMFTWDGTEPELKNDSVLNMLFFKYLLAKSGVRESFTSKWKKNNQKDPKIPSIEGKKIIYIDDEGEDKGWYALLGAIIKNSKAEMIPYVFEGELSKKDLFCSLISFVDKNKADCYIIDLRLHDDDFKKGVSPKDYTGILIAKYIKTKNIGNQVIMFTASNKTWNYEAAIKNVGVNDYVIKESPEYNYSRIDSYNNFYNFSQVVRKAIKKSYIAEYNDIIDSFEFLKDEHRNPLVNFVEMLALDEDKTIRTNILNLSVFIEGYILDQFDIPSPGSYLTVKDDQTKILAKIIKDSIISYDDYNSVKIYDKPQPKHISYSILSYTKPLGIIIIALHYYFDFSEKECNDYLKFRKERNKRAHRGEDTDYTIEDLRDIFEKIILKILQKGPLPSE